MRKYIPYLFLLLFLVSCSGSTHTARSVEAIVWHATTNDAYRAQAPELDCTRVNECLNNGLTPDKYILKQTNEEVYVWANKSDGLLGSNSTTLYVVVNRPSQNTWDIIGLEYMYNGWNVGVYGGERCVLVGKVTTCTPIWYLSPLGDTQFPVAYGYTNESWAVIAYPKDRETFYYSFDPNYWQNQ